MGKPLKIYINGKATQVEPGITVLAALISQGLVALKTSRQIREPRGAVCGMGVCYECRVEINGSPNVRACMSAVEDEMEIRTNA